ncbi:MAG: hypothetical protein AB7I27_08315 [Bacteriovoracaceae bacterium]
MKLIFVSFLLMTALSAQSEEVQKFKARYIIPTQNEDASIATFDLINYTVTKKDPNATIKAEILYEIPFDMTGVEGQTVQMNLIIEKLPLRVFEGEKAIALCEGVWTQMKCTMRFKKIDIKLPALEESLLQRGIGQSEINARIELIKRFGSEPLGVSEVIGPLNL